MWFEHKILINLAIFYINLDCASQRRQSVETEFAKHGLSAFRFSGIDFRNVQRNVSVPDDWNLPAKGECGCALSHYLVWMEVVRLCLPFAIILEDDISIIDNLDRVVAPTRFDVLYLNNRMQGNANSLATAGCGLDGYIISSSGALKLIRLASDLDCPIDLRVQAHCIGFNGLEQFKSKKHYGIQLKALKTKKDHVIHKSSFKSERELINQL